MDSFKRPGAAVDDLDPDRLDQLLAGLDKQLESMPADVPTTEELRQEIETLRAMIGSFTANDDGTGQDREANHTAAQKIIADRLKERLDRRACATAQDGKQGSSR